MSVRANAGAESMLSAISYLIKIAHLAQDSANHLQLDSYMLDVDELQLGAFRFIRSG